MAVETALVVLGVGAAVGLGAWYLLGGTGVAAKEIDAATACAQGTADGSKDGKADSGKAKVQANRLINASKDPKIQAEYDKCYDAAFNGEYVAPKEETSGGGGGGPKKWAPPGPPSGLPDAMREGDTAYSYGCRRGTRKAEEDFDAGNDPDPKGPLSTTNSLARQKESGNPADYRNGYENCYASRFTALTAAKAAKDVMPTSGGERGGERPARGPARHGVGGPERNAPFVAWRAPYRPAFAA